MTLIDQRIHQMEGQQHGELTQYAKAALRLHPPLKEQHHDVKITSASPTQLFSAAAFRCSLFAR